MNPGRRSWLTLGAAALLAVVLGPAQSYAQQNYPDKTIKVIVPFSAGGTLDTVGRLWAEHAGKELGQSVVVENKGGAGGTIGTALVAQSNPDGYTLGMGMTGTLVLNPAMMANVAYNPAKDFQLISTLAATTNAFAVNPSVPAKNLKELVAYIKANQDKLSYCSAGTGTSTNLAMELLKQEIDAPGLVHVPYKGAGPCIGAVVAGDVPIASVVFTGSLLELHKGDKLRILAVASPERLSAAPDIPTAVESGYPNMIIQSSISVLAPSAAPKAVIDTLYAATKKMMADPETQKALRSQGLEPVTNSTPATAQTFLENDLNRLAPLIKKLGWKK
jgi:tripartite-type tricarboxylate transporter receptor subunit TctC